MEAGRTGRFNGQSQLSSLCQWLQGLLHRIAEDVGHEIKPNDGASTYHFTQLRRMARDLKRGIELIQNSGCQNSRALEYVGMVEEICYQIASTEYECRACSTDPTKVIEELKGRVNTLFVNAQKCSHLMGDAIVSLQTAPPQVSASAAQPELGNEL